MEEGRRKSLESREVMTMVYSSHDRTDPAMAVTLRESVRLLRFRTAAAGNGETKTGLRLVFAANMRMTDGRRRAA